MPAPGCPAFPSKDTVLDPAPTAIRPGPTTVARPAFEFAQSSGVSRPCEPNPGSRAPSPTTYHVVWWDPHALGLDGADAGGLRRDDLIAKDGDQAGVEQRMGEYRAWQADRVAASRAPGAGIVSRTATELARDRTLPAASRDVAIEVIDLPRPAGRPFGPRFGSLVHATLATVVPRRGRRTTVLRVAQRTRASCLPTRARRSPPPEAVTVALAHPLFDRVRAAQPPGSAPASARSSGGRRMARSSRAPWTSSSRRQGC